MGTDKETRTINFNDNSGNNPILIRRCTLEDLEGVIEINEKELPEDYPYFFYKSIILAKLSYLCTQNEYIFVQKVLNYQCFFNIIREVST